MQAIRLLTNPADPDMYYVFWDNGSFTPGGAHPPPEIETTTLDESLQAGKAPIASAYNGIGNPFVGAVITNWDDIGGYSYTKFGQAFEIGSAAPVPLNTQIVTATYPYDGHIDFSMNPAQNGQGYGLDVWAGLYEMGGAPALPVTWLDEAIGFRLYMDWTSAQKYVVLTSVGHRLARNGAVAVDLVDPDGGAFPAAAPAAFGPFAAALAIYDGLAGGEGHGWFLANYGLVYTANGAEAFHNSDAWVRLGWNYYYTDLAIADDGTGADPARLRLLTLFGETFEINNAEPPTVAVTAPVDPTTNTMRPTIAWQYGQQQGNEQVKAYVAVFTDAQYLAGGFDPAVTNPYWGTTIEGPLARQQRTVRPAVDLPNDTYRVYVTVTSTGNLSATDYQQWVQNVVPPETPSMIIANGHDLVPTLISLDVAAVAADGRFVVEYRDDPEDTWQYVDVDGAGGHLIVPDGAGSAAIIDWQAPHNKVRYYQAKQVVEEPYLAGAYTGIQSVVWTGQQWTLLELGSSLLIEQEAREWKYSRKVVAKPLWPDTRETAVVISGTVPVKGKVGTLRLRTLDKVAFDLLDSGVLRKGRVILHRDFFGTADFYVITDDVDYELPRARPTLSESTPIRHFHEIDVPVTETSRPLVGPQDGPLALVGS